MDSLKLQDAYHSFIKEHRSAIIERLKASYAKFSDGVQKDVLWGIDFGGCVGFPLLVIGILWIAPTKPINNWLIAAILIGFGFWLRCYQKHTIAATCRYFFNWGEGKAVIDEYIRHCEAAALCQAPESERATIKELHDYYRRNLRPSDFRYYK